MFPTIKLSNINTNINKMHVQFKNIVFPRIKNNSSKMSIKVF